jgi:hypothetical protein
LPSVIYWVLVFAGASGPGLVPRADLVRRLSILSGSPTLLDSRELCPSPPQSSNTPKILIVLGAGFALAAGVSVSMLDDDCTSGVAGAGHCGLRNFGLIGGAAIAAIAGFGGILYYARRAGPPDPGYCSDAQLAVLVEDYRRLLTEWAAAHPSMLRASVEPPGAEPEVAVTPDSDSAPDAPYPPEFPALSWDRATVQVRVLPRLPDGALDMGPAVFRGGLADKAAVMLFLASEAERLHADAFVEISEGVGGHMEASIPDPGPAGEPASTRKLEPPLRPGRVDHRIWKLHAIRYSADLSSVGSIDELTLKPDLVSMITSESGLQARLSVVASLLDSEKIDLATFERIRAALLGVRLPWWLEVK